MQQRHLGLLAMVRLQSVFPGAAYGRAS